MKNQLLLGLLLVLLASFQPQNLFAQHDVEGDEPDPLATITPDPNLSLGFEAEPSVPVLKTTSVISYSDGLSVSIEFETTGITPSSIKLVNQASAADYQNLTVSGGKAQSLTLTANKVYAIKATGSDGQTYTIGIVSTYPYHAGDAVAVSQELYHALSQYVAAPSQTTTLSNYLRTLQNVSQHEQISFLQRYVMNGAVLPASIKGQYPDAYVRQALQARSGEGECLCNFVTQIQPVPSPDMDGPDNPTIGAERRIAEIAFYNKASYHYNALKAQGPAKFQMLYSTGLKAGNTRRREEWVTGTDGASSNYALLGFHYLCLNYNEVPMECACQKTVKFTYDYTTKLESMTNTGGEGCLFNQGAGAEAQDWGTVLVTHEKQNGVNDVQVFAAGLGSAKSTCNGGVPATIIIDALKMGGEIIKVVKSVKSGSINDIIDGISNIADKLGVVLQKYFDAKDCGNSILERPLVQGSATITFGPNDPVTIIMMSGSALAIEGLRCWESKATINSSFHLAGIMLGGSPSQNTPYCCTDYYAQWLTASRSGDLTNHQNAVQGYLSLNGPGAWQFVNGQPNNSSLIINESGTAQGSAFPNGGSCPHITPEFSGTQR